MLLARDNRLSSPGLAGGVARGFAEAGWKVVDAGVVPTPVFYWARVRQDIDAGVMVTGSHNEAIYNGLKLAAGPGTLYGEDIQAIGRLARAIAAAEPGAGDTAGGTTGGLKGRCDGAAGPEAWSAGRVEPLAAYVADVRERIGPLVMAGGGAGADGDRPLRVAVDCGSGTASLVVPDLLAKLGCEVIPLYCELDGTFPGHWPDPVRPENLVELREAVRRGRADAGVAFDGDADRLGVVDETGEILWGDIIMILFWREILAKHPGAAAIVEVKCSQALVEDIRRHGGHPFFYRTGHSLIKAKMREMGALFAGEMSGHMFFADEYYGFDDAIYAAARLLRIVARAGRPLSQLLADRPRYCSTPEVRVDCPDRTKSGVVEAVRESFRAAGLEVVDVDGARVIFPDGGWLLVRASNTQPALVVRCEARTPERLEELKAEVSAALGRLAKEAGLTLPAW
jgi:phosphomannomutase/phosphoglucomutase